MDKDSLNTPIQKHYLHFHASLIRGIFEDKVRTLSQIFKIGIYRFALTIDYDIEKVANHIIYCLYQNKLPKQLLKSINFLDSEIIGQNQDYNGFNGEGEFEPFDEMNELIEYFEANIFLKEQAILYYQVSAALKILEIKGDEENIIQEAKIIEKCIPAKDTVTFMINTERLFDFSDNEKTEFEILQLMAFTAIKSIIGKKLLARTNKAHIVSRMFGYASIKDVPANQSEIFKKYSKRYHIDKVIEYLELHWHLKTYSNHMRGIYVCIGDQITLEMLATIAEKAKHKNQVKELNRKKAKARDTAIAAANAQQ